MGPEFHLKRKLGLFDKTHLFCQALLAGKATGILGVGRTVVRRMGDESDSYSNDGERGGGRMGGAREMRGDWVVTKSTPWDFHPDLWVQLLNSERHSKPVHLNRNWRKN